MGLGDADLLHDDDDRGGGKTASAVVSCSICLEVVTDNGTRSWAKLQCGHQFHLDCIGSAFNSKGAMQCPNCRKIVKGQWLYANGSRPLPEFSLDDWAHDEDLYDLSYYDMSFGLHWCPYGGLTRLPSSFDEGEFASSSYHDLGHHAIFAEHTAVSSTTHHCTYITHFGQFHPSSSASSGTISDGSNLNNQWNTASVPGDIPSSYAFPAMDVHNHSWEHNTSPFAASNRIGSADQSSIPSVTQRSARTSSDIPRPGSFMHPLLVGHSSSGRVPSSTSSMVPPYTSSVPRALDLIQALRGSFQQPNSGPAARPPLIPTARRSSSHRGLAQVAPVASSSDQSGGFYFSSGSSGRNFQEAENPLPNRFHAWEREHFPPLSLNQVDRDSVWGTFHPAPGGSDTGMRSSSFRQRHGSERMPFQDWS